MIKSFKFFITFLVLCLFAACGGGGGSAGGTGTSTGTSTSTSTSTVALAGGTIVSNGTVTLAFVDASDVAISGRALSQTQTQYIKVTVKDKVGAPVSLAKTILTADPKLVTVTPTGGLLSDSNGVSRFKITPASVNASGVVTVGATATVNGIDLTQTLDLVISPGVVTLSGMTVTPQALQRGQSVNASVSVLINGSPATSNSVAVEFSSDCGKATPASALVDSSGKAVSVIQTTLQGDCRVSASTSGSTVSATYVVTAPPVAGIQFASALPTTIYQSGSTGVNTSLVSFKVVDSVGGPVQGLSVTASLTNTDGGINFCNSPNTANSGTDGLVTFSVCGGTLPTTVQVRANLVTTPAVYTTSNILTIQTGLPTQRFFSLSAAKPNFLSGAGFNTSLYDGLKTDIVVFAADRQANPVPNGTPITFVAEGGQINSSGLSSCLIKDGGCTVSIIGQNYRPLGSSVADPRPGRVTVLAYADGEEYFIDSNFNNRYDIGELFEDLGIPFLDKDEDGVFTAAYKNLVKNTDEGEVTYPIPVTAIGNQICPSNSNPGLSVANTCSGTWTNFTKVRQKLVIVFSGDSIPLQTPDQVMNSLPPSYHSTIPDRFRTAILNSSTTDVQVRLSDANGNPPPADASVDVAVIKLNPDGECAAKLTGGSVVGSTTEPIYRGADLEKCSKGDKIVFKLTVSTPGGKIESVLIATLP